KRAAGEVTTSLEFRRVVFPSTPPRDPYRPRRGWAAGKIGVMRLNGAGRSSLLRILAGVDKDHLGETVISPGFTVGFLEQEPLIDDSRTAREVVEEAVKKTVSLLKEFDEINAKFGEEMSDE